MNYLITLKNGVQTTVEALSLTEVLDGTTVNPADVADIQELSVEFQDNGAGS